MLKKIIGAVLLYLFGFTICVFACQLDPIFPECGYLDSNDVVIITGDHSKPKISVLHNGVWIYPSVIMLDGDGVYYVINK